MDVHTHNLFERVAEKLGWTEKGGLETAEKNLMKSIGKTRHNATSVERSVDLSSCIQLDFSDREDKENTYFRANTYRNQIVELSSDDDFDQFLLDNATPKCKAAAKENCKPIVSSDSDGFETFLTRVKTPQTKPKRTTIDVDGGSDDGLKHFIVDDFSSDEDFIEKKPSSRVKSISKPRAAQRPVRKPLHLCDSPVFLSDSDDDNGIVMRSTWKSRHPKSQVPQRSTKSCEPLSNDKNLALELPSPVPPSSPLPAFQTASPLPMKMLVAASCSAPPKRTCSAPSVFNDTDSSEEEFVSLVERLKLKNKVTANSPKPTYNKDSTVKPQSLVPAAKVLKVPGSWTLDPTQQDMRTPGKSTFTVPKISQTEPRQGPSSRVALCKTPGCFLQSLSVPGSTYGRNFKQNKEELTSRLYKLYNTSVFDSKLPISMPLTWNKKMRKTAGYCVTGQERGGGSRYARIELSEKVCDSADRLRDTLVHEMCHAATWLINGVRDGHGNFWKLYARKATLAHPELPMVTRCHSYDIKYKYQYQCTRCKNTIGRHSKSLDTQRFVCALCTGQLVLLTPANSRAPTPFANFVKENYGNARQKLAGQSHGEVMRKLSVDFTTKTKLSQS